MQSESWLRVLSILFHVVGHGPSLPTDLSPCPAVHLFPTSFSYDIFETELVERSQVSIWKAASEGLVSHTAHRKLRNRVSSRLYGKFRLRTTILKLNALMAGSGMGYMQPAGKWRRWQLLGLKLVEWLSRSHYNDNHTVVAIVLVRGMMGSVPVVKLSE